MGILVLLVLFMNSQFTAKNGIPPEGYIVIHIENKSVAQKIGLKIGYIVLSENSQRLTYKKPYIGLFSDSARSVDLTILRDGDTIEIKDKTEKQKEYIGSFCIFYTQKDVFSPSEMREDVDSLISVLMDVHPNPFASLSKKEFEKQKREIYDKISDSMKITEFWKLLAAFVASLGDGHTYMLPPNMVFYRDLFIEGKKIVFPFSVKVYKDTLIVLKNYSTKKKIKPGDLIVSINEIPTEKIIDSLTTFISGEVRHFKTALLTHWFNIILYHIYGWEDTFSIKVYSHGRFVRYSISAGDKQVYRRMMQESKSDNGEVFIFNEIPELKTAILTINTFSAEYKEKFEDFLKSSFEKIQKRSYKYLVIDVRENTGGSTVLVEDLVDYITNKPYRTFSMVKCKRNKHMGFDSTHIETFTIEEKSPSENPLRFKGRVFVLTSNTVFSSANAFVLICKDYNLATIVGEETGGIPNSYGDVFYYTLPDSLLSLGISFKYFVRPSGDTTYVKRGIQPDISVTISPRYISENKDPILEKVKEIIREDIKKHAQN